MAISLEDVIKIVEKAQQKLDALFVSVQMPESHGLSHCLIVLDNMNKTISHTPKELDHLLTPEKILTLRLAALLHEADDHKFFKASVDFENAKKICEEVIPANVENKTKIMTDVVKMISYVSASVNGNSVPDDAKTDPTFLWSRYCDRLESIGVIGAVRCYQYNTEVRAPLMVASTPRPATVSELWDQVKDERWQQYQNGGNSQSMMDHYYDKLLHIAKLDPEVVRNDFIVEEANKRVQPLVNICLESGRTGEAPIESLKKLEKSLS